MDATIIIPTRERRTLLLPLLGSIRDTAPAAAMPEIIVVDDGSRDGTTEAIRTHFPGVRILEGTGAGPSAARNLAARAATGDLLLFLDDDGEVTEHWLSEMRRSAAPDTILLGNVVDYRNGRVQSLPRRATFLGKSVCCQPGRANTGPSCNLGVPRALFERLGGFDEELPYYFEDSDLCIRARGAGCRFRFVEGAVFRHHGTERKTGEAVRLQEKHSTYAMLKRYEGHAGRFVAFSVINAGWLAGRCAWWTLRGRGDDAARLASGWGAAYRQYLGPRL